MIGTRSIKTSRRGFWGKDIENEMGFVPLVNPSEIVNPLKRIDVANPKIAVYSDTARKMEQENNLYL